MFMKSSISKVNFFGLIIFFLLPQILVYSLSNFILSNFLQNIINYLTLSIMLVSSFTLLLWNIKIRKNNAPSILNKRFQLTLFIILAACAFLYSLVILYILLSLRNGVSI